MVKRYRDNRFKPERRYSDAGSKDPIHGQTGPTSWKKRRASQRNSRISGVWTITPITAVLSSAVFWGVWTWTAPNADPASAAITPAATTDQERAAFGLCHDGGGYNCVVDGDTIYYQGVKIRIADIDTPETHEPRCAEEAQRGAAATRRMHQLVNAGSFRLNSISRDEDNYGRKLRVISRRGESLGGVLVDEGLARWYAGGRRPWC
jgi:endonuclease YncB( thermonuclease family)